MSPRFTAIVSLAAGILFASLPSHAHHGSNVVYDLTQSITISGTVTRFQFVNPHALIFVEVTGEDGETVEWLAGLPSASGLGSREGWTRDTIKPGDEVTIIGAPARSGAPSLWTEQITRDGEEMLGARYTG
jgi:hypothetical protein